MLKSFWQIGRGVFTVGGLCALLYWLARERPSGWTILGGVYFLLFGTVVIAALVAAGKNQGQQAVAEDQDEEESESPDAQR